MINNDIWLQFYLFFNCSEFTSIPVRSPKQRRGSGTGCRPASDSSHGRLFDPASTLKGLAHEKYCFNRMSP
jgi:hypothetical protein